MSSCVLASSGSGHHHMGAGVKAPDSSRAAVWLRTAGSYRSDAGRCLRGTIRIFAIETARQRRAGRGSRVPPAQPPTKPLSGARDPAALDGKECSGPYNDLVRSSWAAKARRHAMGWSRGA